MRYAPSKTKIVSMGDMQDCSRFSRIVLVSNDFHLFQVRGFDQMQADLAKDYRLVTNTTLFPAQVTAYEKGPSDPFSFPPSRLDLPEQDLRFPLVIPRYDWRIDGFVRLDDKTPSVIIQPSSKNFSDLWILTNYRVDDVPETGTPVFRLQFKAASGKESVEVVLHAGEETASWRWNVQCLYICVYLDKISPFAGKL